jgi:hypothetical protein
MQTLIALIEQYGLALVFANVLLLQLGAPLPAYPTLIAVGALAAAGVYPPALVVGVAGCQFDCRSGLVFRRPAGRAPCAQSYVSVVAVTGQLRASE